MPNAASRPGAPGSWSPTVGMVCQNRIARQVVAPTLVAYVAFLLALRAGSRTPTRRTPASAPPADLGDWARLVRFLAATADVQELTLVTADDRLLRGKGFRTLANR